MLNIETRAALKRQRENETWMARRISKDGLGSLSQKETSFCGRRVKFHGSVPNKHAVEMARLNRKTSD